MGWECKQEKYWLKWLDDKRYTTLFVDGNHEKFDRLGGYPVKEWKGGLVHEIRPSVLHLMRGQVYELAGKRIFAFGGASSHDVSGGILDTEDPDFAQKKKEADSDWKPYRIKHLSWRETELPSDEEYDEASKNLEKINFKVDYIISHCCSTECQNLIAPNGDYVSDSLTDFLILLEQNVFTKDGILVTTIWICTNPPVGFRNAITRYAIQPECLVGNVIDDRENYDLLSVVMVCLGKPDEEGYVGLLEFLEVLFSQERTVEEKKRVLEDIFDVPMTEQLESEVRDMCNLSEGIFEKGIEQGIEQGEKKFAELTKRLVELDRTDDIIRATSDQQFKVSLYQEFKI